MELFLVFCADAGVDCAGRKIITRALGFSGWVGDKVCRAVVERP